LPPEILIILSFILGLLVGSFLNVVMHRLPIMMEREWRDQCRQLFNMPEKPEDSDQIKYNLIVPRSSCPHCLKPIHNIDNIPVISYLLLRGRCRHCTAPISLRYPMIELITAIVTALIAWHFNFELKTIFAMLLTWALLCLAVIDIDKQLLPDNITLPFLWLGLACSLFHMFTDPVSSLIGAMLGYSVLWAIFMLFKLLTGKEGMGYGDFKLLAMLGAWTGWQMLPLVILLSSVLGSIVGIYFIIFRNHEHRKPIPFGPYLALSGWIALLWGSDLNRLYLSVI
jgi:leader peptidase (prepilin peptidase)/N-methyltransferase